MPIWRDSPAVSPGRNQRGFAGRLDVVSEKAHYLPGIGQQNRDGWGYFLTDGLGSVRQLTDESGTVTYAASYDPYGNLFEQFPIPNSQPPVIPGNKLRVIIGGTC